MTRITRASLGPMAQRVEVWLVPLDRTDAETGRLLQVLSPEECERAGEAPRALRKRRYVARQAALRTILAERTESRPADITFTRSTLGRPELEGAQGVRFSVSDSAGLALVAVAGSEIGVDVEQIRERPAAARAAALGIDRFFERWTELEATGKALGTGLTGVAAATGITCAPLDVGPGFAAAVAVATDRIQVRLRPYFG